MSKKCRTLGLRKEFRERYNKVNSEIHPKSLKVEFKKKGNYTISNSTIFESIVENNA